MNYPALKRLVAVLVIGSAFILPVAASAKPSDSANGAAMADRGGPLPLKATFEKNASATTEGPYVLTLTNTSHKTLKVSAKVDQDVTAHNRPKSRDLGPQEIAPGKDWKIDDLAALDKVTVKAHGFQPLKLTVEAAK